MRGFRNAIAGAALGLLGVAAVSSVQAQEVHLNVGGAGFGVTVSDNFYEPRGPGRDRWRRDWRRGDERRAVERWRDRRYAEQRRCTPGRALLKAERLGLRRAWVRDVDRNAIRVAGRRFGERYTVVFGRAPSCPILRF